MEKKIGKLYYPKLRMKNPGKNQLAGYSVQISSSNRCSSAEIVTHETNADEFLKERTELSSIIEAKDTAIKDLEAKLKELQERYDTDVSNMQNYINLLRKKISNTKSSAFSVDDQVKKEKEKALVFYKALKAKEKECNDLHNSPEKVQSSKFQLLLLDKNRLEASLFDTEKDMKRLYQEIKYQSEIIASYKDKLSVNWEEKHQTIANELDHANKVILQLKNEKAVLDSSLKESQEKIAMLTEKILYFETIQYGDNSKLREKDLEIDSFLNYMKKLESAKSLCQKEIHSVAKEINDKYDLLSLKTEQLENEENRIQHLLKLIQQRVISSGLPMYKKIAKELEIAKQELEDALRENYDLHETLEEVNAKSLEAQEELLEENSKLKEEIRQLGQARLKNSN